MKTKIMIALFLMFPVSVVFAGGISVHKVSDDLHVLNAGGLSANMGLIQLEDTLVLIDPMPGKGRLPELDKLIQSISDKPIAFILNTHFHNDHNGGNSYFMENGAMLVDDAVGVEGFERVQLVSHTTGDTVFYHKASNTIFTGDIYDRSWHPTFYAGGVSGLNAAVDRILELGDERSLIVPGHGSPAYKPSLREFRENTLKWVDLVRELRKQGMSEAQMQKNKRILAMVEAFNVEKASPFLPEKAFVRFIERTVAIVDRETAP
ncbi:MBL fold metallo-hydrolase [Pseudoteredinibacter isoporae]|uniref:MBL fold metallo-hydrolase n=1 Tax=Pseudoteredinibacter isoporae TaxID=570281 RepID=UPI003105E8E0